MHSHDLCWRLFLKVMNCTLEVQFGESGQLGCRHLHRSQLPEDDSSPLEVCSAGVSSTDDPSRSPYTLETWAGHSGEFRARFTGLNAPSFRWEDFVISAPLRCKVPPWKYLQVIRATPITWCEFLCLAMEVSVRSAASHELAKISAKHTIMKRWIKAGGERFQNDPPSGIRWVFVVVQQSQ